MDKIVIPLQLMTLNQYTNANRTNRYSGAKAKKQATEICRLHTLQAVEAGFKLHELPAEFEFNWFLNNRRTDPDNIAFQKKFILDGFVAAGLLSNDGWGEIAGWTEKFHIVKKEFQRVEIKEV